MIENCDCLNGLSRIEDNSIDLLVTDPPYGIGFMGKDWDRALPDKRVWEECLRVLRPGAFAFVMSIPRSDCLSRMIISLEDAGFRVNFTPIYWAYASGFPKAQNISKAVDKRLGAERVKVKFPITPHSTAGKGTSNELDERPWLTKARLKGYNESYGNIPSTPQAKFLDGSYGGFQPKPAVEVIIVAMKPLSEKTYVDQALKSRKGITWLDDARIPYQGNDNPTVGGRHRITGRRIGAGSEEYGFQSLRNPEVNTKGRFPANLLVSDDVLNDGNIRRSGKDCIRRQEGTFLEHYYGGKNVEQITYGDSGSFSRYFDLDKWWEEKIKQLPASVQKTFPFLVVPKASKSEKNKGCEGLPEKQMYKCDGSGQSLEIFGTTDGGRKPRSNNHPTVKPIKLISYLITLGSRTGDTVLDPFLGSGTTAISCEILGRNCIGYEIDRDYFNIAIKRIEVFKNEK